jgi:transposase
LAEAGDPHRRQELATKYGVTYSHEWVDNLVSRYGLRLLGE